QFCELRLADRISWICKHSNGASRWNQLKQKPQPLCRKLGRAEQCDARDITAGSIEAGNYPEHHRVAADDEDNWNGRGRRLGGADRGSPAVATITATRRLTKSAANAGSRSYWPSA